MITAVDTNILLDVLVPGAPQVDFSEHALTEALQAGAVVIYEVVYAELSAHFLQQEELDRFLTDSRIVLKVSSVEALYRAGTAWRLYRSRRPESLVCTSCGESTDVACEACGAPIQPRQHVVADFLIGAQALVEADRLLTRDRGYYRTYFPELRLTPTD